MKIIYIMMALSILSGCVSQATRPIGSYVSQWDLQDQYHERQANKSTIRKYK